MDDCCVGWDDIIKKSKSFDEDLFVVVVAGGEFIGCKRSWDAELLPDNKSNGSKLVDEVAPVGCRTGTVVVGQIEVGVLNKYLILIIYE